MNIYDDGNKSSNRREQRRGVFKSNHTMIHLSHLVKLTLLGSVV